MELTNTEIIQLWFHYEEIAMHFNELLLRYRMQLMGGAGAIGTLLSYLIGSRIKDVTVRHWVVFVVSLVLLVIISAAAALDLFYYNQLLLGAVDALLEFENMHPIINMSTRIEEQISNRGLITIRTVYAIILLPLLIFTIWSGRMQLKGV